MRKKWKVWLITAGILIILCGAGIGAALWRNLASEWRAEAVTAQFALDHSPLNSILSHQVFTSSGLEEVYDGLDVFHRRWYVFVYGQPLTFTAIPAKGLLSETEVRSRAERILHVRVQDVTIGYLQPATRSALHTQATVVWEIHGKTINGKTIYAYLDAGTGQLLWQYLLKTDRYQSWYT
ncbi:MAG: hypothetical protein K6T83_12485 [Alicyclobacillus sp.]|nr:hypothetical protein [Alicyclobacillus sp.]